MWVYKIRYYSCDGNCHNSQGIVAGGTLTDCYKRFEKYYGEDIEELVIHALDSDDGLLDFGECECGLTYENFVKENS